MKSDVIKVSSREDRTEQVLDQAARMAFVQKLSHKSTSEKRATTVFKAVPAVSADSRVVSMICAKNAAVV